MMLNVEKALKQPGENLEFDLRSLRLWRSFRPTRLGFPATSPCTDT